MNGARAGAAVVLTLLLTLAGCRSAQPPRPIGPLDPGDLRARSLLQGLATAADDRRALRGTMRLSVDGPSGSLRTTQAFVVEQPSHLRVEVQGFLAQTVAVLVTDGERFDLLRTTERTIQRGRVYPGLLFDVARIDLAPEEAVEVLLGAPRVPDGLEARAGRRLADGGAQLDLADPTGAVLRVVEWGPDALLRRMEARSAGGVVLWQAEFDDFRRVDRIFFAHRVAIHFPPTQTELHLEFDAVELNPPLSPDTFVLRVPGANVGASPGDGA